MVNLLFGGGILLLGKNVGEAMELLMKMNFDRAFENLSGEAFPRTFESDE